jgi:hypothetical protein
LDPQLVVLLLELVGYYCQMQVGDLLHPVVAVNRNNVIYL